MQACMILGHKQLRSRILLLLSFIFNISAYAQQFVLTPNGLCNSEHLEEGSILFSPRISGDFFDDCYAELNSSYFIDVCIEKFNRQLVFSGYLTHVSFLVSGTATIRYIIYMDFLSDGYVSVKVSLTYGSGKQYNCSRLYNKGKIITTISKDTIEAQINDIVEKTLKKYYLL